VPGYVPLIYMVSRGPAAVNRRTGMGGWVHPRYGPPQGWPQR
jgi:hypothetical protein